MTDETEKKVINLEEMMKDSLEKGYERLGELSSENSELKQERLDLFDAVFTMNINVIDKFLESTLKIL